MKEGPRCTGNSQFPRFSEDTEGLAKVMPFDTALHLLLTASYHLLLFLGVTALCFLRALCGWSCGVQNASLLPLWRHCEHGFPHGIHQPAWVPGAASGHPDTPHLHPAHLGHCRARKTPNTPSQHWNKVSRGGGAFSGTIPGQRANYHYLRKKHILDLPSPCPCTSTSHQTDKRNSCGLAWACRVTSLNAKRGGGSTGLIDAGGLVCVLWGSGNH